MPLSDGVHGYRRLDWTITTMTRQLRGLDDFEELWEHNRLLGPMYYMAWTIVGAFIFMSLFVVVLLEEVGDISKQFNIEGIVRKVAVAVRKMKLDRKNESHGLDKDVDGDDLTGIDKELSLAVKRQHEREGKSFIYGHVEAKKTSVDQLLSVLDKAAKDVGTEYCEITKQRFREIQDTVVRVSEAVTALNAHVQGDGADGWEHSRPSTRKRATSIRTLTGGVFAESADIRKILSRSRDSNVSPKDVTSLKQHLQGPASSRSSRSSISAKDVSGLKKRVHHA